MRTRYFQFRLLMVIMLTLVAMFTPIRGAQANDREVGHKWSFTYFANQGAGELHVTIALVDTSTQQILDIYREDTYSVACRMNGTAAACNLDIKGAITASYAAVGIRKQLPDVEEYCTIYAATTGTWQSNSFSNDTLAQHPSLSFAVSMHPQKGASFRSNWSAKRVESGYFSTSPTVESTMMTSFAEVQQSPSVHGFENYLWQDGKKTLLGVNHVSFNKLPFQITKSTIIITPPANFDLETFVIDPPKYSFG